MPAEAVQGFRLSPQQQHLWRLQQGACDTAYQSHCVIRIEGVLKTDALEATVRCLVERHEVLRTGFLSLPGMTLPLQVILSESVPKMTLHDLTGLEQDAQEERFASIAKSASRSGFDVRERVFHASLVSFSSADHRLIICLPAVCADAISLANLAGEVAALYAESLGHDSLSAEALQYADASEWLNQLIESPEAKPGRDYWQLRNSASRFPSRLPVENQKRCGVKFDPKNLARRIEPSDTAAIDGLAASRNAAGRDVLLAALYALLFRLSAETRITIGVAFNGRVDEELDSAVGLFARFVPVECEIEETARFLELVDEVSRLLREAERWQECFDWKTAASVTDDNEPFFPFCFEYLENRASYEAAEVRFSLPAIYSCIDRFKLKLSCTRLDDSMMIGLHYDPTFFSDQVICRLVEEIQTLIDSAVAEPAAAIADLNLIGAQEYCDLAVTPNAAGKQYGDERCVHELMAAQSELTPERAAVIFEDSVLSYGELNRRANQLANYLRAAGVGPDSSVAVLIERSPDLLISLFAVLKAGAAYLPLDTVWPRDRIAFILKDASPAAILTEEKLVSLLPPEAIEIVACVDRDWNEIGLQPGSDVAAGVHSENLAYVIYTSGSTGEPKGVMITHRGFANYVQWSMDAYSVSDGAGTIVHSPVTFDLTVTSLFVPLSAGTCVALLPEDAGPAALVEALRRSGDLSLVKITPAHLEMLNQTVPPAEAGGRTRSFVIGGEALYEESLVFWRQNAPLTRLINEYGPTESVVGCCVYEALAGSDASGPVPIGHAIANTRLYILDSRLRLAPHGVEGELYIGGLGLARGYLNRPDLTAGAFIPEPIGVEPGARLYRSGDVARRLPDGSIEYLGRIDGQVKLRGYRVELGEVEAVLKQHTAVREAAVAIKDLSVADRRLVAYVSTDGSYSLNDSSGGNDLRADLRRWLADRLPEYMLPSTIVALDELPLTRNGKIDRRALQDVPELERSASDSRQRPANELQEVVAGLFARLLSREHVGVHENFFELGGHSLLATRVISGLRQLMEVELPLQIMFDDPTAAGIAEKIERQMRDGAGLAAPPIVPAPRTEDLPLSFAQQRLWFQDQLVPNNPFYNVPAVVRARGSLDIGVLEETLSEVVRRHEVLRTEFGVKHGEPVQVINEPYHVVVPVIELTGLQEEPARAEMERLALQESRTPFDLSTGPLFRTRIIRLGPSDHVVLFTMHHIISDAWSMALLVKEVGYCYERFAAGELPRLDHLSVQYADYSMWQRRWMAGEVLDEHISYWSERLSGELPILELQPGRARPERQTFGGGREIYRMNSPLNHELKTLSIREGVTLFMLLLTGFKVLLHKYSGQEDILVGVDIANRNRAETESLIGFLVNQLVLRTDLSGNPTFRELLRRVRKTALGAYSHQDLPFEKLVEAIRPDRTLKYTPLFQVKFGFDNAPVEPLMLSGIELSMIDIVNQTSRFDLTLTMTEDPEGLLCGFNYNRDLFDRDWVMQMAGQFERLLHHVVAFPDSRLRELKQVLEDADREQLSLKEQEIQQIELLAFKSGKRQSASQQVRQ